MGINIHIVCHGVKEEGPNPLLTEEGKRQVEQLKPYLLPKYRAVVCGTGRRHLETAKILGLTPTRYTPTVGDSVSKSSDGTTKILPDGTKVPAELCSFNKERKGLLLTLAQNLSVGSIIIASREIVESLGFVGRAKLGAIYEYNPKRGTIFEVYSPS